MKLISFQILLISFSALVSAKDNPKSCAVANFGSDEIFDTDYEKVGLRKIYYKNVDQSSRCFVSLHAKLPKSLTVKRISDCSQHFHGNVTAGEYAGPVPPGMGDKQCYFQHDWIICLCEHSYCNSPQYWPMILSRFIHSHKNHHLDLAVGDTLQKTLKLTGIKSVKSGDRTHLKCLAWLADSLGQEDYDPPFYLYNYITTLHDAPPLEDALSTAPKLKYRKHNIPPQVLHYTQERLREDRSSEKGDGQGTGIRLKGIEKMDEESGELSNTLGAVAGCIFLINFGATVYFLLTICRKLKDHSMFVRNTDQETRARYERLYTAETVPTEFTRKKTDGKVSKKSESVAPTKSHKKRTS